jgi:hypothetical protein
MNAPLSNLAGINIVGAFTLHAKTSARRYADGKIDLRTAVDEIQQLAEASGLVAAIGQDAVQAMMSEAFAAVRGDLPRHTMVEPATQDNSLAGIDWCADWGTDASAHMFARVRELCGVKVGPPELTPEMITAARQDAHDALEQTGGFETESSVTAENINSGQEHELETDDGPWAAPSWREAAIGYHKERDKRASTVSYTADEFRRRRAMMDDNISLERMWREFNRTPGRAAKSTVDALMHSLCEHGTAALEETATRRRLHELSDNQLIEVSNRLQRLKPEIARAWTIDEIKGLVKLRERFR